MKGILKSKIKKVLLPLLIIMFFQLYIIVGKSHAFGPSSSTIYQGIDVSGWQETIDYSQVSASGIEIVYMKSSEGNDFVDPYFNQNYTNAKANGLKVGFYHYLTATSVEEAINQANFFVSTVSGKNPDCLLAMDFESFNGLSVDEINAIGLAFMQTVERISNKRAVIYSDTSNATSVFGGELTNYPLWVAQYGEPEPTPNGNWETWVGWQYTDQGEIPGISTFVDRDQYTDGILLDDTSPIPNPGGSTPPSGETTTTIIIQHGDTLNQLAIQYNTTVATLVQLNNIVNPNLIYAGATLIVPISGNAQNTTLSGDEIYIVKPGDTLSSIASQYNTTVRVLAVANNIRNVNLIYVGQRIIIPTDRYDTSHLLYKVRWGDTLWGISRRYGVSIATIVRLNRIANPNLIYAGDTLRI